MRAHLCLALLATLSFLLSGCGELPDRQVEREKSLKVLNDVPSGIGTPKHQPDEVVSVPHARSAPAHNANKTVHVNSYTRRDGTVVQAHDRAAPGQGTSHRKR